MVTSVENTMVTLGSAKKEDICNIVRFDDLLPADVVLLQEGSRNLNLHLVSGAKEGAERGAAGALLLNPELLQPQLFLPLLLNPQFFEPGLLTPLGDLLDPDLLKSLLLGKSSCLGL